MRIYKNKKQFDGQAMAEFLVSMLMLVPFIVCFTTLNGYLEIQKSSYEAVRFIAWEETARQSREVWQSTGDVKNIFFKHPYNGLVVKRNNSKNALLNDMGMSKSLMNNSGGAITLSRQRTGGINAPVGVSGALDFSSGGKFKNNSLAEIKVAVPLSNSTTFNRLSDGKQFLKVTNFGTTLTNLTIEAEGAILGDPWLAKSETYFGEVTSDNSLDGPRQMAALEQWSTAYRVFKTLGGFFYPMDELIDATANTNNFLPYSALPSKQSMVLPRERVGP